MPVWVAPMAMHGLAHPGREVATCRAAAAAGVPFTFSTVATSSLQEIQETGHDNRIFQLYVIRWAVRPHARCGWANIRCGLTRSELVRRPTSHRHCFGPPVGQMQVTPPGTTAQSITVTRCLQEPGGGAAVGDGGGVARLQGAHGDGGRAAAGQPGGGRAQQVSVAVAE